MALTGPVTSLGIKTYAAGDRPDLYSNPGGLTEILNQINALLAARPASGLIVNADISAAAAIAISKLAGYPADLKKFPRGDGTWAVPVETYTKSTTKEVTNSLTETDMHNGELTLIGGRMSAGSALHWYAYGDYLHNENVGTTYTFRNYFGATVIAGPGTCPSINGLQSATRSHWWMEGVTLFTGAAVQWSRFRHVFGVNGVPPNGGTEGAGADPVTTWYGTSTVDTSVDQLVKFTAACSVANAAEAFRLQGGHVRVVL